MDALTAWQADPLNAPLLQAHTKVSAKLATDAFRQILAYTSATGTIAQAAKLVDMLSSCPEVRDEVFFQLIKQTRTNPDQNCEIKTWELFLIVATLFPSSRNSETWIKSHIARHINTQNQRVADLVQFTYIRFSARCASGKPADGITTKILQSIPKEVDDGKRSFGASLYEQLFHQRVNRPRLPYPYVLYALTEKLFEKGADRTEGVFRIPGNGKKILDLEAQVNSGDLSLNGDLHDVGSLFKSWFVKLPEPIVGEDRFAGLKAAYEKGNFLDFINELPRAPQITLKFLIGFLQRLSKASEVTRMTPKNLGMVFAPNIVALDHIKDPLQIARATEMIQEFLVSLVSDWDTTDIYPTPPSMLGE
jgi:hypothetical protein